MDLVIEDAVTQATQKHPKVVAGFDRWAGITREVTWSNLLDVRGTFPTADGVAAGSGSIVTVFNLSSYRLITFIDYPQELVIAIFLLTHAEYDKEKWKRNL